jgi:peroxiredoxin
MARAGVRALDNGDPFPAMECRAVGEGTISLPGDFTGRWTVLLFYRGHW